MPFVRVLVENKVVVIKWTQGTLLFQLVRNLARLYINIHGGSGPLVCRLDPPCQRSFRNFSLGTLKLNDNALMIIGLVTRILGLLSLVNHI